MHTHFVFLCGYGGSGKTTCGELLFEKMGSVAFIDADSVFIAKPLPIGEKMSRLKIANTVAVMKNFVAEEYQTVICVGLIWSQAELDEVVLLLKPLDATFDLFWLEASRETRQARVLRRGRDAADSDEFLENVEKNIQHPWPLMHESVQIVQIRTDDLSVEEVTQEILKRR